MSVARRLNAERIVLFGWARAILLQLAHPLIAAGVYEHSGFRATPIAAVSRLHHTVGAMLALTFGTDAERDRAIDGIRLIHTRVNGRLAVNAGRFTAGTCYSAEDPDLLLWVHATLLESVPVIYELLVAPLSMSERDAYCDEAAPIAIALGARAEDVPRTWQAMLQYRDAIYASNTLAVTPQAREVAAALLSPALGTLIAPATSANRRITIGLLPDRIRSEYGFAWTDADERALARVVMGLRLLRRYTPRTLALWPASRR